MKRLTLMSAGHPKSGLSKCFARSLSNVTLNDDRAASECDVIRMATTFTPFLSANHWRTSSAVAPFFTRKTKMLETGGAPRKRPCVSSHFSVPVMTLVLRPLTFVQPSCLDCWEGWGGWGVSSLLRGGHVVVSAISLLVVGGTISRDGGWCLMF